MLEEADVREFSTPLTIEIPATGNLTDDVVTNAREAADAVVFSRKVDGERPGSSPRSVPSPRASWPPASSPATGSR
jgi:hypothetical protein